MITAKGKSNSKPELPGIVICNYRLCVPTSLTELVVTEIEIWFATLVSYKNTVPSAAVLESVSSNTKRAGQLALSRAY